MSDPVLIAPVLAMAEPLAQRLVDERGLAGLVVGVAFEGETVFAAGYGSADIAAGRPMTTDTVVRVGSITKTFTALAVAQLVERGILGWDDPVSRYLRAYAFRPAIGGAPMTIRDVLTHTSGMGEWRRLREKFAKTIPFGADDGDPIPTLTEFYRGGLRADTRRGVRSSYSNHAMASLGQLVEDVTGTPYATWIKEQILEPLGMHDSDVLLTDAMRARIAQGYSPSPDGPVPVPYQHIVIAPAGSLHATLDDMLRYAAWLSAPTSNGPVEPETLATMFERHWEPDQRLPGQGLAWSRDDPGGEPVVYHDGGWPGFVASLQVLPNRRFAVFAATNTFDLAPRAVTDALTAAVLGMPDPAARVKAAKVRSHPDVIRRIAGVYAPPRGYNSNARWWNEYGGEARIEPAGDGLRFSTPKGSYADGVHLVPGDADDPLFWVGAGNRLGVPNFLRFRFSEDVDGEVTGFVGGVPSHMTMRKHRAIRSVRVYKPLTRALAATAAAAAFGLVVRKVAKNLRVGVR